MPMKRRPWQEELAIIDGVMKSVSDISDPEELVGFYWNGISELIPLENYLAISRRDTTPPNYFITRSSRFTEHPNPWTQRHLLPHLSGGVLGEIAYANKPVIIDDLPSRLTADDPAHFYLEGYQSLIALPQYDRGEGLNVSMTLLPPGHDFDQAMIPMMHWQAGLFGRGTQNLVLRNELSRALSNLDRELLSVGEIQRSLLPQTLPQIPGFELAAYYRTSARAGGDYYDFFPLCQDSYGLFIADVSGHGTPAAVLMAITHAIAHSQPGVHTPSDELLIYLNNHLTRSYTRGGTFVTAFYAVLDPVKRTLRYSTAGHNPPRLVRDDRVISLDGAGGLPLGILEDQTYAQQCRQLEPGDLLLLYTDGITEAMTPKANGPRELFGVERLDKLLVECRGNNPEECIDRIRAEVAAFTENSMPGDDQTLIAIRVK